MKTLHLLIFTALFSFALTAEAQNLNLDVLKPDRYIVYYKKDGVKKAQVCKTKKDVIDFLNGYPSGYDNPRAKDLVAYIQPEDLLYVYDLKDEVEVDVVEFTIKNKVRKKTVERKEYREERWKNKGNAENARNRSGG